MKGFVERAIRERIKELYSLELDSFSLEPPREEGYGDYATNVAFLLSKFLRKNPQEIAQELASKLSNHLMTAEAVKGFVNIRLSEEFVREEFKGLLTKGQDYFFEPVEKPMYIQVEFVSANPTGPLHVGHGRGAVVGDVLSKVLQRFGHKVLREYYINDAGNQVYMLGLSVLLRYYELFGKEDPGLREVFEREGYKGKYIKRLAKDLRAFYGEELLDLEREKAIDLCKEYAHRRLLEDIKETLELLAVAFDSWFSERSLYERGLVEEVMQRLREKGHLYERDGALWFKSTDFGDDKDRVVRKSDGSWTYFASDIAYHYQKFQRGFDRVINLWGADHHGYERRLIGALKALDVPEDWLKVEFVQMVRLMSGGQEVRMSKRTGEFITLQELIEEVGKDAVRFVFLTRDSDTPLDFDIDLVKKNTTENPVFYVQYAHARIRGVFREVKERYGIDPDKEDLRGYLHGLSEEDLKLIKRCLYMKDTFEAVAKTFSPHLITYSLLELAREFHHYYNHHRVMVEDKNLMLLRLALFKGVEITLRTAFELLGIEAPERM
ncbi:arginine--tRNA ligase [Pampinifervens florentissimum]|uniref:arginine--tRNA ligase n=1 Tax=Pampinifervens florentissimum TaxID=1632019 RepID=UPI0013B4A0EB|nr:arginine--tRNA ligase [Hydrogenobacter sp. T-8]QID33622.1 arginine--tRNA ligase [Hydrogenobacter sp. T-8]